MTMRTVLLHAVANAPVSYPLLTHSWEQLVRCMPARIAMEAEPHSGLGLQAYVQVTSPLRRYNDCLVHRQLKAFAAKQPLPYSKDTIQQVGTRCFTLEKMATKFEDSWNRYILLQKMKDLLKEQGPLKLHATVLDVSLRGLASVTRVRRRMSTVVCGVVLNDLGIRFTVPASSIPQKGENVDVCVEEVHPDSLRIKASLGGKWFTNDGHDYSRVLCSLCWKQSVQWPIVRKRTHTVEWSNSYYSLEI